MIQANPYCRTMRAADLQQLSELFTGLGMVGMEVAGIDPHLIYIRGDGYGGGGGEMDISNYGNSDALGPQSFPDFPDAGHVAGTGDGDSDYLCSGSGKTPALGHSFGNIMGMSVAHCLDNNFVKTPYNNVSYIDFQ